MERFPDAWENSYRKLPRSGIPLICFEPGRRHVVPRIAFARHADFDAIGFEQIRVVLAGVLRATVGMMHQTGLDGAARKRQAERRECERIFHRAIRRPADYAARVRI